MNNLSEGLVKTLWKSIVHDSCRHLLSNAQYERLKKRCDAATMEWLLVELPQVGRGINQCLATNRVSDIVSFVEGSVPELTPVAEKSAKGDALALRGLRQALSLYSKLRTETPLEYNFDDYIERVGRLHLTAAGEEFLSEFVRPLLHFVLDGLDLVDGIFPRHGPGAVAGGELPWEKGVIKRWCRKWDGIFDPSVFMHSAEAYYSTWDSWEASLEVVDYFYSRVCLVPKDFRGPRLICAEAWENQFLQQGQGRKLMRWIERCEFTRGFVNFTSQDVNRHLACKGSSDGSIATLDLSDASDYVSRRSIELTFPTRIFRAVDATRAVVARLPDGRDVQLATMSPMGSALCFPIESLFHWAVSVVGVAGWTEATRRLLNNRRSALSLCRSAQCYVYGDDIIVPSEKSEQVMSALTLAGLRPNPSKCCTAGPFRESCGWDCFNGVLITPIRIKTLPDRRNPEAYTAAADYISDMLDCGYRSAAISLERWCASEYRIKHPICYTRYPNAIADPDCLLPLSPSPYRTRHNSRLQVIETEIPGTRPILCKRPSYRRVVEAFIGLSDEHSALGYAVPHRVRKTMGWSDIHVNGVLGDC